jgi:hypothetical protein
MKGVSMTDSSEVQARRLESVRTQLMALTQQVADMQHWYAVPKENEWSAMQIMGHMVEMIPHWMGAIDQLISSNTVSPQFGRDLSDAGRLQGVEAGVLKTPDEMINRLGYEMDLAVDAIRNMTEIQRGRIGVHVKYGEMSVADLIELLIVAHAEEHLEQIRILFIGNE